MVHLKEGCSQVLFFGDTSFKSGIGMVSGMVATWGFCFKNSIKKPLES